MIKFRKNTIFLKKMLKNISLKKDEKKCGKNEN